MSQMQQTTGIANIAAGFMQGKQQRSKDNQAAEMSAFQKKALDLGIKAKELGIEKDEYFLSLIRGGSPATPTDDPSATGGAGMTMGQPDLPGQEGVGGLIAGMTNPFSQEQMQRGMIAEEFNIPQATPVWRNVPRGNATDIYSGGDFVSSVPRVDMVQETVVHPDLGPLFISYDKNDPGSRGAAIRAQSGGVPEKATGKPSNLMGTVIPQKDRYLYIHNETGEMLPPGITTKQGAFSAGFKPRSNKMIDLTRGIQADVIPLYNELNGMIEHIWGGPTTPPKNFLGGIKQRGEKLFDVKSKQISQTDPVYAKYIAQQEMFLSTLAKKLSGEVGVLTDKDIERIRKGLPQASDTNATAQEKMDTITNLINAKLRAYGVTWLSLPTYGDVKPTPAGPGKPAPLSDPLGIR